jgi:hypothetical protein
MLYVHILLFNPFNNNMYRYSLYLSYVLKELLDFAFLTGNLTYEKNGLL